MKIFTWHIHGSYLYFLSQGDYEIFIPVNEKKTEGYYGRGQTFPFGKNVMAANGSKAVVDYISKNENAIGFVGSSWVTNDQDPEQKAYQNKVRLALIECQKNCDSGSFAKPSQATITYDQYPLVRPLYYVLKENWNGLGTGFSNFLNLERGQLVFRRSYLVPAKMYFGIRTGNIQ